MKIAIIYPKTTSEIFSEYYYLPKLLSFSGIHNTQYSPLLMMPAALPTIAALTPKEHDVRLLDENIESIDFDEPYDIVGVSFYSLLASRGYEIADEFRRRGVYVVIGGVHASVAPDEVQQHADTVVIGEAEETWPQFLKDFQNNNVQKVYRTETKPDLKKLVIPRWDKIPHKHYLTHCIQTTRGCPFNCDFCSVSQIFGKQRFKPVDHVVKEIEALKRQVKRPWPLWISFSDDNIVASRKRAKELFRALIPLKIKWWSQASINISEDEELLSLAQASGCDSLLIGFESLSQKGQEEINKGQLNKVAEFKTAVQTIQKYGISLYPSFIFGLDADDSSVFKKTFEFIQETGMEYPLIGTLTPWMGTRLYDRLKEEGRLFDVPWHRLNSYEVYFTPKNMTSKELIKGHRETIKKLYTFESIFERVDTAYANGGLKTKNNNNLLLKLMITVVFLKELMLGDRDIKKYLIKALKYMWGKKDFKFESLLFLLDRLVFARKLTA